MLDINAVSSDSTEAPVDYTGGPGFMWDQNVHEVTVTQCYGVKKTSGSMCLHFEFENSAGKKYKEDCYFLSSKGRIDYPVKKDGTDTGRTRHIPGFIVCANIIAVAFPEAYKAFVADESKGKTLTKRYEAFFQEALQSMTSGTVKIYDYNAKSDIPTDVDYIMLSIVGKSIKLALNKNMVNKEAKNDAGTYVPTAETREVNEIANSFTMNDFTAAEMLSQEATPSTHASWIKANAGKTNDKRKIKTGSPATGAATTPAAEQHSMFG